MLVFMLLAGSCRALNFVTFLLAFHQSVVRLVGTGMSQRIFFLIASDLVKSHRIC